MSSNFRLNNDVEETKINFEKNKDNNIDVQKDKKAMLLAKNLPEESSIQCENSSQNNTNILQQSIQYYLFGY